MNEAHLVRAAFLMLAGTSVAAVSEEFKICRTSLYRLRRRAMNAVRREIERPAKNRKPARNRTPEEKEDKIVRLCQRHTTASSYQISRKFGQSENETVNPRTIQRIRKKHSLVRVPKRSVPSFKAHRFTDGEKFIIRQYIKGKMFLGGERLAWDIRNQYGISISPSTAKRIKQSILREISPPPKKPNWRFYQRNHPHRLWHGDLMEKVTLTDEDRTAFQLTLLDDYSRAYVFCDLFREVTVNTVIKAMVTAMRKYETVPQAVVFDNGSYFKGKLLREFCRRMNIRLIHSSVNHPQTNGKLERAFRDDMNEFYKRFDQWKFQPLKRKLLEYIKYRNEIRGHLTLDGKPSADRLKEQDFFALPHILDNLEKFAWCERGERRVGQNGLMRFFERDVYINPKPAGQKIKIFETLDGLESEDSSGKLHFLADYKECIYRSFWQLAAGAWRDRTRAYYFRPIRLSRRLETENQVLRVKDADAENSNCASSGEKCSHSAVAQ